MSVNEKINSLISVAQASRLLSKNITSTPEDGVPTETFCDKNYLPDVETYLDALQGYGIGIIVYGAVLLLITICISFSAISNVIKYGEHKSRIVFILCVYPVVNITLFAGLIVPRASLLTEAVGQCMFTFCLYQLFCLFITYCGGESELIRNSEPDSLNLKVGPCCCYPCCMLPVYTANKKNILFLRMLILQLPIVMAVTYSIFCFIWVDQKDYAAQDIYIQPILVCSILTGVWGIAMTIKMVESKLPNHKLSGKFFSLQCVMICTKLQGIIVKIILFFDAVPCLPPLSPPLYSGIIFNCIVMVQITLLSLWSRNLYMTHPTSEGTLQVCQLQTVCTNTAIEKSAEAESNHQPASRRSNNNSCYDNQNFVIDVKM